MRLGYDKLDLLGVQYDAELELRAKHDIAKKTAEYWKNNCSDEDFYKNCLQTICNEFHISDVEGPIPDDVYDVWDIIEKEYMA